MLKLFHAANSVCSQKVRVGLAEIGLEYDSVSLNLQKGDQFDPEYLKLNPDAVVPTLIDDGLVLVESSLILEYLDREHNKRGLMPCGRAAEATARYWLLRCIAIHAAINTLTFSTANRKRILAEKNPQEIAALLAKMPDPVMRAKRKDLFDNGLASPYVGQALMYLRRMFADMASALASGPWVSGGAFGISDIALVAYVDRLDRLGFSGLWQQDYATVGPWLSRMKSRPSYAAGIAAFIPPELAAAIRTDGEAHWPELEQIWQRHD